MRRFPAIFLCLSGLALASCASDGGSYPDLSDAPPAPKVTLTQERTDAITHELEDARAAATAHAAQGRRETTSNGVPAPEQSQEQSEEHQEPASE